MAPLASLDGCKTRWRVITGSSGTQLGPHQSTDCVLTLGANIGPDLADWLSDTLAGTNQTRDVEIGHYDAQGNPVDSLEVDGAFLTHVVVPTLDSRSTMPGHLTVTFYGSPIAKHSGAPTLAPSDLTVVPIDPSTLRLTLTNVGGSLTSVTGLRLEVPEIVSTGSTGEEIVRPGPPVFGNAVLGTSSDATAGDLDAWVAAQLSGGPTVKSAVVQFGGAGGASTFSMGVSGLLPVESLDPFARLDGLRSLEVLESGWNHVSYTR